MTIQVSNLNKNVFEAELRRLFKPFGDIESVELVRDKWSHRSTGRAYVTMPVEKDAQKAVLTLDGTVLAGKYIAVASFEQES